MHYKPGDTVFVIVKYVDTENSLIIDIRKRILKEPVKGYMDRWRLVNCEGSARGCKDESEMFETKLAALHSLHN